MAFLDLAKFEATPVADDPFPHVVVRDFIFKERLSEILGDFPRLAGAGAFPPAALRLKGGFRAFMDELTGPWLRPAMAAKFDLDLDDRPLTWTLRGYVRERDGQVHTDTASKLVTMLLYLNENWESPGGRLRLLRSRDGLADPAVEVFPEAGTLLAFRRSAHSWHGHLPYRGRRRAIQLNFVTDCKTARREAARHLVSARLKQCRALFHRDPV